MKKLQTMILICGTAFCAWRSADAAQLRISDGSTTITVTDGDLLDSNPDVGVVTYNGPVGPNWIVNISSGTTKPSLGSAGSPFISVGTTSFSSAAGTLKIAFTETGFTASGAASVEVGGTTAGDVTCNLWMDPANTLFGETTLVSTVGPLTPTSGSAFSGMASGVVSSSAPYSLTVEAIIDHPGVGLTTFTVPVTITPPTCNCTLNFTSPASISYCSDETISNVTATGDCGSGPVPAIVTMTGAATNGICPKIITTTNIATDGCGTVHTFVQTVTVNCTPDCTVTPSVAITIVGTTGLKASVADAGPGATYIWSISNGNITAGQGTTTITWTAGTDVNSPAAITVTVTTAAGCSATCSAPVYLTSKPPPSGLGAGDSATIGFWHNKNGQGLILGAPSTPSLADWLASNFPCMYGSLAGESNSDVAKLFLNDFGVKGQKTYAQILGGALDCYFTSSNLGGGSASAGFGFNVTPGGTGAKLFNVGLLGTTIGLKNNTSYTVLQILQAANANINCSKGTFSTAVFNALNTIFDGINSTGDINS